MQAPVAHNSSVRVHFGDQILKDQNTPLHLSFTLDFFSQEQQITRQSLQENLKTKLEPTALVFELQISNGEASKIAEQLNNSQTVKNAPSRVVYHGNGNKLYVSITGEELTSFFETQQSNFAELKNGSGESHIVQLNINSQNSLTQISELIKEKDSFSYGWLNSLELDFQFSKTSGTSKIITIILEKLLGFGGAAQILHSFKKLDFQLNCSSAKTLNEFPKVKLRKLKAKPTNDVVQALSAANIQQARVYLLNETIFLKGDLQINGLTDLLSTLCF